MTTLDSSERDKSLNELRKGVVTQESPPITDYAHLSTWTPALSLALDTA